MSNSTSVPVAVAADGSQLRAASIAILASIFLVWHAQAFSLLGPYADWMDVEKGYRQPGDIGGPMNITEGYRWNVPVLTYGFTPSFVNYFGSNGVAAVEGAIGILNAVPPASSIDLESDPLNVWRVNWLAEFAQVLDLKSQALALVLEQLGLADSERYVFCVRDFEPSGPNTYAFFVIGRNFDPVTGSPSPQINANLFTFQVVQRSLSPSPGSEFCFASNFRVDPDAAPKAPVSGLSRAYPYYGIFAINLSLDDIGGLRFLLSANQVRVESLLPDVHAASTNNTGFVRTALRPGIEKIAFVRHPGGIVSSQFLPFTNHWTDVYLDNGVPAQQEVQRVTMQPDILFAAGDLGPLVPCTRSGTTNWANHADLNGNPAGAGPGVITPPVTITFNNGGPFWINFTSPYTNSFPTQSDAIYVAGWGSFDASTNSLFTYPDIHVVFAPTQVHLQLMFGQATRELAFFLTGPPYGTFALQTATNFSEWTTLTTLTNSGAAFVYEFQASPHEPARSFRAVPLP